MIHTLFIFQLHKSHFQVESAGLTFVFMVSKCLTLAYYAFLPLLTQSVYTILGSKLLAPVVFFAELVLTGL